MDNAQWIYNMTHFGLSTRDLSEVMNQRAAANKKQGHKNKFHGALVDTGSNFGFLNMHKFRDWPTITF
jgi:hypothetical protein